MILTFKSLLLIIMCLTLMGTIAEDDQDKVMPFASICIASMLAFVVSAWWM